VLLNYVFHVGVNLHGYLDSSLHTGPSTTYSMSGRKQLSLRSLPIPSTRIILRNIPPSNTIGGSGLPRLRSLFPLSFPLPCRRQARARSIPSCSTSSSNIRKEVRKGHTMRVVKTLAKQHSETTLGATLCAMHGVGTHETTVSSEEQVCVGTSQTGEGIEGHTVDSHKDRRRKARL
jgi:hypothetical protein